LLVPADEDPVPDPDPDPDPDPAGAEAGVDLLPFAEAAPLLPSDPPLEPPPDSVEFADDFDLPFPA
jgi:hypothetical protein